MNEHAMPSAEGVTSPALCSGHGQRHTQKYSGGDYPPYTLAQLWNDAAKPPPTVAKDEARWCLFHDQLGKLGRDFQYLFENARVWALWLDVDHDDPPIERVIEAVRASVGDGTAFVVYTSRSHGEQREDGSVKRKYRAVIPLAQPVPGHAYTALARALQ